MVSQSPVPTFKNWGELRQGLARLADLYGEKPDKVLAALDRGGALVNVIAAMMGVQKPKRRRGRKPSHPGRDGWLIAMEEYGRSHHGLKGERLVSFVHHETDTNDSFGGINRSITPAASKKAMQRAKRREETKIPTRIVSPDGASS